MHQSVLSDSLAVRYGMRFGIALALLGACTGATIELLNAQTIPEVAGVPCCVFVIFIFWVLGEAGHWTAERTGTIGSGTLAGAIAGGLGGVSSSVALYVVKFVVQPPHVSSVALALGLIIAIIFGTASDVCIFAGLGAACGAFGASIGKAKYEKRQTVVPAPALPPDTSTPPQNGSVPSAPLG